MGVKVAGCPRPPAARWHALPAASPTQPAVKIRRAGLPSHQRDQFEQVRGGVLEGECCGLRPKVDADTS